MNAVYWLINICRNVVGNIVVDMTALLSLSHTRLYKEGEAT